MLQPPVSVENLNRRQIQELKDANYVQIIRTSETSDLSGHSTILVHPKPKTLFPILFFYSNLLLVVHMHEQIASGEMVMIASNSPNDEGTIYKKTSLDKHYGSLSECRVGTVVENRPGTFHITVNFSKNYNILPN